MRRRAFIGTAASRRRAATTPPPTFEGPITVSSGQTISNRWFESTSTGTPAVTINTTAQVTFNRCYIKHRGKGAVNAVSGIKADFINCKFEATNPTTPTNQRAIDVDFPARIVADHCLFKDGHGCWHLSDNGSTLAGPFNYKFCEVINVGRYGQSSDMLQFVQFDKMKTSSSEIAWNRVTNTYGQSDVEDNINMFESNGVSGSPIWIHHNLIDGGYALTGTGSDYSGGGIMTGDNGGSWILVESNRIVSTSNYGIAIVGGNNIHMRSNRCVNDAKANNGSDHGPDFATGISLWQAATPATGPNTTASDNVIGWRIVGGARNDTFITQCNPSNACTNNTSMSGTISSTTEQAERDGWATALVNAGFTVGPDW
jgi:hypothetical protein